MKKIWLCNLTLLVVFIWASPGMGEFYRYKDAHGNIIYTDDLSKVPAEQRSKAEMYEESQSPAAPSQTQEGEVAETPAGQQPAEMEALQKEGERLLKLKTELDKEYNALVKENAELKTEQQAATTPEQIKSVNKKVVSYNTRFQAYHEKSSAYEADVKAYNEKSKAADSESKPESGSN
jgi:Zn-dependent M32 family carboxypeptidase